MYDARETIRIRITSRVIYEGKNYRGHKLKPTDGDFVVTMSQLERESNRYSHRYTHVSAQKRDDVFPTPLVPRVAFYPLRFASGEFCTEDDVARS